MLHFTKPVLTSLFLAIFLFSTNALLAQPFSDQILPEGYNSVESTASATNIEDVGLVFLTTAAPVNDLCEGATELSGDTSGDVFLENVNLSNATQTDGPNNNVLGRPPVCTFFSSNIGNGVWYTFTGSGGILDFVVDDANAGADLEIALYTGTCGNLVCAGGSDNPESVLDYQTEEGVVYYIYIGSWASFDTPSGTFDFTLTGGVAEKTCTVEGEMEILTYESGCGAGPDSRVVSVTFTGELKDVEYTLNAGGSSIITEKGMGIYQVVGYGPWSIEATGADDCVTTMSSEELVYVSDVSAEEETGSNKNDGSATVEVTGGMAPYTVTWPNDVEGTIDASGETHTNENLSKGYYEVLVTDADDNTAKACIYVGRKPTNRSGRARGRKTADVTELNTLVAQPNPFSNQSTVQFSLPEDAFASVQVFSLDDRQMDTLFEGQVYGGENYQVELNASDWASGIYILHMTTDKGLVAHERLLITK